jgi:peptidoglycan-associated lipoprotein
MSRSHVHPLWAGLLVFSMPACGSNPEPPPKAATERLPAPQERGSMPAAGSAQRRDTASSTTGSVHIDEAIVRACGNLPVPHFAFDSAAIEGDAAIALQAVATCFAEGPLKGRDMLLIGHADPRGDTMYNLALGQNRAGNVAAFFEKSGLPVGRVRAISRGEFDATGTDENGWARDRRVDIFLADLPKEEPAR